MTDELEAKKRAFWSRVQIGSKGACWTWTACRDGKGYGLVRWAKCKSRAHRVAWQLMCGAIPAGICVLHHCDNPPCCNPAHLFLGTLRDNIADKVAKGRGRGAPGERQRNAKLNEPKIRQIRDLRRAGFTLRWIGSRYGIAETTVCGIANRRAWRHVE